MTILINNINYVKVFLQPQHHYKPRHTLNRIRSSNMWWITGATTGHKTTCAVGLIILLVETLWFKDPWPLALNDHRTKRTQEPTYGQYRAKYTDLFPYRFLMIFWWFNPLKICCQKYRFSGTFATQRCQEWWMEQCKWPCIGLILQVVGIGFAEKCAQGDVARRPTSKRKGQ